MQLKEFLEQLEISPSNFAKRLNVSRHAVYNWINKTRFPKPEIAKKIVEISLGKVSYDEIYSTKASIKTSKGETTPLKQYLIKNKISVKSFAKSLGVPINTVYSWLSLKATPRNKTAKDIVNFTNGEVSFQDLFRKRPVLR